MDTTKNFKELYADALERLVKPITGASIGSGFAQTDKIMGSFRPHEFTILCGATGVGKTTLLANWSAEFLKQQIPHFVASVETGPLDYIARVMSSIDGYDYNTGEVVDLEKIKQFHTKYSHILCTEKSMLSLREDRFSVDTLIEETNALHEQHGIQVAMFDNLNFFLEVTSSKDAIVEMDRVIHNLIIWVKQVPIHVIMVMHPKKTENGRVESEFDIKGSSTAVQEAQNVLLFNKPHPDLIKNGHTLMDREIKFAKLRRRGRFAGKRIIFKSISGVKYEEDGVYG